MRSKASIIPIFFFLLSFLAAQEYKLGVLYFDTPSGDSGLVQKVDREALARAVSEMMISDLSHLQILTLVERENLNRILDEQTLGLSGLLDESSAIEVGELLGAEYLMTGTLIFTAANVSLSCRINQAQTGEILASATLNGPVEQIFRLQETLLEELVTQWDIPLSRLERQQLSKRENAPLRGLIQLGNALKASDMGDYQTALSYLERAVDLSPDFTLAENLLESIKTRFDTYIMAQEKELPIEIMSKIDELAAGAPGAEIEFPKMYWTYIQPLLMGVSYYGSLQSIAEDYREEYFHSYVKTQWNQMGLTEEPETPEVLEMVLGEKLYQAYSIMDYLLEKDLPLQGYSAYLHPVEGAMGYFLTLFATISSQPDWGFPPMINQKGAVVMTKEQYYPLLLSYCDMFLTNFPYSTYQGMVTPMMHALFSVIDKYDQN